MGDITQRLHSARHGDASQLAEVFAALYPELHRIARARSGAGESTLTPTVLVHEAFLRLSASDGLALNDRRHFFACVARSMRCILVDHARRRSADKRGGGAAVFGLDDVMDIGDADDAHLLALDEALIALQRLDPRRSEIVELHWFGGLAFAAIAELLGISERTAKRDWERARAFLYARMSG